MSTVSAIVFSPFSQQTSLTAHGEKSGHSGLPSRLTRRVPRWVFPQRHRAPWQGKSGARLPAILLRRRDFPAGFQQTADRRRVLVDGFRLPGHDLGIVSKLRYVLGQRLHGHAGRDLARDLAMLHHALTDTEETFEQIGVIARVLHRF